MPNLLAFAEGAADFDVVNIMQTAIDTVKGNLFSVLLIAVPAIAAVIGAVVAVKFGIKWVKSLGRG